MHRAGDVPSLIYIRAEPVAEWGQSILLAYRKPGIALPPKNGFLERAQECRLPGPKRTLHGYVAYYRF